MTLQDRLQQTNRDEPLFLDNARGFSRAIRKSGPSPWAQMKRQARDALLEELGTKLYAKNTREELVSVITDHLDPALGRAGIVIPASQRDRFIAELTADLMGYGPIEELLADPDVNEIMCNGHDDIYIERNGQIVHTDVRFSDEAHLRQVIDRIVASVGRRIDESSPMVDARLPDGSRVNAVLPPIALDAPILTIRRFPHNPYKMADLVRLGTLTPEAAAFLQACVVGKLNVLVAGGTGTGKTTLLNLLADYVPANERIVTIEDSAEMRLAQPHVVRMETRPKNIEGAGEVIIWDLVRNALRMRPDRILVGEVRGPEALDMLQAMNTGHEGSLTTLHANSTRDALIRLETMVMMAGFDLPLRAIRQQIASAVDIIIHVDRFGDGRRHIARISEVQGMEDETILTQDIFSFDFVSGGRESKEYSGTLRPTGLRPKVLDKLQNRGIEVPPRILRPVGGTTIAARLNAPLL